MIKFFKGGFVASSMAMFMATPQFAAVQDATTEIGGLFMLNYVFKDIKGINETDMDLDNTSSEVRQARLFAKGKYGDSASYKLDF